MNVKNINWNYTKVISFSWIGWLFDFYNLILYSFLMLYIPDEINLTDHQLALIYSASLSVTALGGIILGYLSDIFGRKTMIVASIMIFSLGVVLCSFAQSFTALILFQLITGFGIGGEWAAGHTLVNETIPKKYRGSASAFIQTGAPLGAALAAVVGSFLTPIIGWRWSYGGSGAVSLFFAILMIFFLPESPKFLIFKAEAADEMKIVEDDEKERSIPRGAAYIRMTLNHQFKDLKKVKLSLLLGIILSFFALMAYWVIFSWAPKYLKSILDDASWVGKITLLAQLGAFIGYLSFGFIADITEKPKITFFSYTVILATGATVFAFAGTNKGMLILSFIIIGLGTGIFSGFGPLFAKIFPQKVRATGTSVSFNTGRLGTFFAPLIVTLMLNSKFGFSGAIILGGIFALIAGLWIFLIPSVDTLEE
ncbi:MAG: MFS transporter [Candidatus Heimdallarchaeaceae archaeon]